MVNWRYREKEMRNDKLENDILGKKGVVHRDGVWRSQSSVERKIRFQ